MEEHEAAAALDTAAASPILQVGADDRRDPLSRLDAHRAETREESAVYAMQTRAGDWEGDPRQHHAPGARLEANNSTQGVILGVGVLGLAVEAANGKRKVGQEKGQELRRRLRNLRDTGWILSYRKTTNSASLIFGVSEGLCSKSPPHNSRTWHQFAQERFVRTLTGTRRTSSTP